MELKYGFAVTWMAGCFLLCTSLKAQISRSDSAQELQKIVVSAYGQQQKLVDLPAAVSIVSRTQIERFGNQSILPALNSQPGIRMEERSPGSYRLNIRGSSLRAPFGVRNVKIYYNNLPYSTPSGDSYFNQLGFYDFQQVEIIKGPGSSLYGAGTGGVVLISSEEKNFKPGLSIQYTTGSFQTKSYQLKLNLGNAGFQQTLRFQKQSSAGYRNHTALKRTVLSWETNSRLKEKNSLTSQFFYGDLFYESPGGLTLGEFKSNPTASRPSIGNLPSAEAAQASISQKTFYAGISHHYQIYSRLEQTTSVYGAYTRLNNPGIFNYSSAVEPHTGGRLQYNWKGNTSNLIWGGEVQQGFSNVKVSKNAAGVNDSLRTEDDLLNLSWMVFAQGKWNWGKNWELTSGISLNHLKLSIHRIYPSPTVQKNRDYSNVWAPRLALLKKWTENLSSYLSYSRGFSPPTSSELLPSSGIIATELEAEKGNNIEIGSRGSLLENRLYFDVNLFHFGLKNAIVIRRDALGRDYFVNAGATNQKGIEGSINYRFSTSEKSRIVKNQIWASVQFYQFKYSDFVKSGVDFSGKKLPSVPDRQINTGWDLVLRKGFYSSLTINHTGSIPLNDANSESAQSYTVFSMRVGWKGMKEKLILKEVFISGENLTNERYCLGHDLNASGGRYYNTAAGRGFYVGLRF